MTRAAKHKALVALAARTGKPTRTGRATLRELRLDGYVYTCHRDGRTFAHLTARGRDEIGREAGLAR